MEVMIIAPSAPLPTSPQCRPSDCATASKKASSGYQPRPRHNRLDLDPSHFRQSASADRPSVQTAGSGQP
eukprot:250413-Pleurochrysis_carterae.AAC.1